MHNVRGSKQTENGLDTWEPSEEMKACDQYQQSPI